MSSNDRKKAPVFLIAIDGHGGSGKSTLADLLAKELSAEIIHTDDFASWDKPLDWWPRLIEEALEPIKNGARLLNYERGKWWQTHNPTPVVDQPVTPIMILEGVSALRKEFRPYIDYGIFVDTPREVFLQRGFERDQGNDGKTDSEIKEMWQELYDDEIAYIDRDQPQSFANLVVDGTKSFSEQIDFTKFRQCSLK